MKSLPPLSCSISPTHLKFIPSSSNPKVLAAGQNGALQICHLTPGVDGFMHANINGYLTHMDVSSSGEVFALSDSFGGVQLWSLNSGRINSYSRPSSYIDLNPAPLPEMDDQRLI